MNKKGTYVSAGDATWTNYDLSCRVKSDAPGSIGVIFRYRDVDNYYRFVMDALNVNRRIVRRQNGINTQLAGDNISFTPGQWYNLQIRAQGPFMTVYLNGSAILTANDQAGFNSGKIGLYDWENNGAYFDDIQVVSAGPLPPSLIRVNAGGGAYIDSTGAQWSGDSNYSGGAIYSTTSAISRTPDPALYQNAREGDFSYQFAVPNGRAWVNLKFAEFDDLVLYDRTFNVSLNGQIVVSSLLS